MCGSVMDASRFLIGLDAAGATVATCGLPLVEHLVHDASAAARITSAE
jgi:hypothetical protein